ncbi:MAG: hypothetical protein ACM3TN_20550 [Alphaproteobacteria bacterium]
MNDNYTALPVVRIELCHGLLLLALMAFSATAHMLEPKAVLFGGLFMGVNFLLLSMGIRWILTPAATKKRVRAGVILLGLKLLLIIGFISMLFFRFHLDGMSFGVGVTSLLIASILDRFLFILFTSRK